MSSFILQDFTPPIEIKSVHKISQTTLQNFPPFKKWSIEMKKSLSEQYTKPEHPFKSSPYILRSIEIQSIDEFKTGKIGFLKLKVDISNDRGESLPGIIFMRGGSVAMLVRPPPFIPIFEILMDVR